MKQATDLRWLRGGDLPHPNILGRARALLTSRSAPAILLFLLGPLAYHRAVTPGWLIADWDLLLYVLPYHNYLLAAWQQGRFLPLWNPHTYLGAPYLANSLASVLYPPNLLALFMPVTASLNWQIALHTGLAGAGMYLYAVHCLRLRRPGSSVAGLIYMLGAFMVSHAGQFNQLNAMAWTPWLMLAVDRAAVAPKAWRLATVAVIVALLIAAGHTQYAYYGLLLGGLAAAHRLWWVLRRQQWQRLVRTVLLLAGAVGLGVALVSLQLAATLDLLGHSVRSGGLGLNQSAEFSLPFSGVLSDFLPDYSGEHRAEFAASVGTVALLLIALALAARWRRPAVGLWALLGLVAIAVAFGPKARVYDLFHHFLPGFDLFRVPARVLLFATVAAAILAGQGTRTLQQMAIAWRRRRLRSPIIRAACVAIGVVALSILAPLAAFLAGSPQHGVFRAFRPIPIENVWLMVALAGAAIVVGAAVVASRRPVLWLMPVLVLTDLSLLSGHTYPMNPLPDQVVSTATPTSRLFPADLNHRYLGLVPNSPSHHPATPIPSGLSEADRARYAFYLSQMESAAPNMSMSTGALDADGYEGGVLPLRSYVDFRSTVLPPGTSNAPDFTDRLLTKQVGDPGWLRRAGVTTVVTEDGSDPNLPGSHALVPVDRAGWLVAWSLAGPPPMRAHMVDGRPAEVVSDTGERVVVRLPAGASGRLVLADTYYPGWNATVDGQPVSIEPYDGYVRSVTVPDGAQEVVFTYQPRWLVPAAFLSGLALLVTLALAAASVIPAWRRR
jgi:hypothetical protein